MRIGRVILAIIGVLTLIVGLALTGVGSSLIWANATQRDASGYFNTPNVVVRSSGAAVTSSVTLDLRPGPHDWVSHHPLGTVRVRASVSHGGTFVGIAPTSAVLDYLTGVPYDQVTSMRLERVVHFRPVYHFVPGTGRPASPGAQSFWVASSSGSGVRTITWTPSDGRWTLVVMRADARWGVVADVKVGTNTGWVLPLGAGLTGGGVLLLFLGGAMLGFGVIGLSRSRRAAAAPAEVGGVAAATPVARLGAAPGAPPAYPARLDGQLDASLSRWRWLVKWFLVLPHAVILVFLWLAVASLTFVAGVAILFTGTYPRSIFDFTVGVIRWSWRVAFYAFSALGTDRYPPFSLQRDDTYPANFDVDYPASLSRGLVLVKWWLLAIPQYFIVGVFAGGGVGIARRLHGAWSFAAGGGVIGLLVMVAALVLLFTGRYPEPIFEFVMGLNRWCYRVLAYVLLLRDEYPPFRLDLGGVDPGSAAPPAPAPAPAPVEPDPPTGIPMIG